MDLKLKAQKREESGKRVRSLRAQGKLPAVVYGHRAAATPLLLDAHEFDRVFLRAGRTHLVDLVLEGGRPQKVLVREVQRNPRRQSTLHVDLYRVDMREKLVAEVPVLVSGEAPIAKLGDADVIQLINHLRVECLPADIPEHVEVDVSGLENVGDGVRVRDLQLPDNLAVLTDGEELIVRAQPRRVAEVEEEAPPAEGAELPEETSSEESPAAEGTEQA